MTFLSLKCATHLAKSVNGTLMAVTARLITLFIPLSTEEQEKVEKPAANFNSHSWHSVNEAVDVDATDGVVLPLSR